MARIGGSPPPRRGGAFLPEVTHFLAQKTGVLALKA